MSAHLSTRQLYLMALEWYWYSYLLAYKGHGRYSASRKHWGWALVGDILLFLATLRLEETNPCGKGHLV